MRSFARWLLLLLCLFLANGCNSQKPTVMRTPPTSANRSTPWQSGQASPTSEPSPLGPGFKSQRKLEEHFQKHGREFNADSPVAYLALAQALRDKPVSADVLEARRPDGTFSRFDKASGSFLACNADRTIRTFFKPNDGERYFRRQINRKHE